MCGLSKMLSPDSTTNHAEHPTARQPAEVDRRCIRVPQWFAEQSSSGETCAGVYIAVTSDDRVDVGSRLRPGAVLAGTAPSIDRCGPTPEEVGCPDDEPPAARAERTRSRRAID
ncbi:hypothetical protein GCM10023087_32700 [Microbacterium rhizosphaerae]